MVPLPLTLAFSVPVAQTVTLQEPLASMLVVFVCKSPARYFPEPLMLISWEVAVPASWMFPLPLTLTVNLSAVNELMLTLPEPLVAISRSPLLSDVEVIFHEPEEVIPLSCLTCKVNCNWLGMIGR